MTLCALCGYWRAQVGSLCEACDSSVFEAPAPLTGAGAVKGRRTTPEREGNP